MKLFLTRAAKVKLAISLAVCLSVVGFAFLYAQTRRGTKEGAKPLADQPTVEQARGEDSASKKVRTELVRRLLAKLDSLDDISAEDKKKLERILLEADAELARDHAAIAPRGAPAGRVRFEHAHARAALCQVQCGGQARIARTDHEHVGGARRGGGRTVGRGDGHRRQVWPLP